ncbi:uncharacterized protein Fot_21167 [Forsythia ovata]|uniref:Uncharacterized protein n=1 Tax=Forsythia ovata TaxID=205694 RepID=A0ABD1UU31_9LAMI
MREKEIKTKSRVTKGYYCVRRLSFSFIYFLIWQFSDDVPFLNYIFSLSSQLLPKSLAPRQIVVVSTSPNKLSAPLVPLARQSSTNSHSDFIASEGLGNKEVSSGTIEVSQPLAPIGTPALNTETPADTPSHAIAYISFRQNLFLMFIIVEKTLRLRKCLRAKIRFWSTSYHLRVFGGINQQVMALTQTHLRRLRSLLDMIHTFLLKAIPALRNTPVTLVLPYKIVSLKVKQLLPQSLLRPSLAIVALGLGFFGFSDAKNIRGADIGGIKADSSGTQSQPLDSTSSSSGPPGTWQQCHSSLDSIYVPPAGYTGPFTSPPSGIPVVHQHMVVYNHFSPVGQHRQVVLSFMGTTYIPSGKQSDWKHNPSSSAMQIGEGEMSSMNTTSAQRNVSNMSAPVQHLTPASPFLPIASRLPIFDVSLFQV